MDPSLSVLLPVHNAQDQLEVGVIKILDVLPELTSRFDLLIIDDGSTDDTTEIAYDLTLRFPQVSMVRHPWRLGMSAAIQTGLDNSDGSIVFVGDEKYGIRPNDLHGLWEMRRQREFARARQTEAAAQARTQPSSWITKFLQWQPTSVDAAARDAAFYMIRRDAVENLRRAREVAREQDGGHRIDTPKPQNDAGQMARPNYLNRARRFAAEE